ncbi:MAG: DNA-3-methyladenine glycosylase I, partial [Gammaproteobacteria bacterium]|nr:DNA-3-methyladenine glycosylase I [Gammaproteobacteria bacterium]
MTFKQIYSRAIGRKGEQALAASLPRVKTRQALIRATDDSYLSEMAKCVFRSGFVWKIVEKKWSNFEIAFAGFNPKAIASFSDERLESLAQDKSIIRNMTKILSTRENAKFILETISEHKSFGRFLADWPEDDIVGLLL